MITAGTTLCSGENARSRSFYISLENVHIRTKLSGSV